MKLQRSRTSPNPIAQSIKSANLSGITRTTQDSSKKCTKTQQEKTLSKEHHSLVHEFVVLLQRVLRLAARGALGALELLQQLLLPPLRVLLLHMPRQPLLAAEPGDLRAQLARESGRVRAPGVPLEVAQLGVGPPAVGTDVGTGGRLAALQGLEGSVQ
jgi:hypothetical protein